ncbi:DUF4268 domain-containing protein [Oculatella sp. LEGE 06141]|uniref:DUF4268 domain-containing protein n=1 Tax=Oculatella sp. LEGE 06141 TaxID=1828648 RepID=UPI0018829257|nr:DUF4268 domain-containing protein [Oculatella sp. LEGE 06141]MBE9178011.1 DUF4268 domain-containing protein [Oculatella sp. LEGE 06141]
MPSEPSKKLTLGRLEKVDLRTYWREENAEFTPWLAQEDNIKLLGDATGMELEVVSQEQTVGSFRADILCRDTATDRWVLIENQLEPTNHHHLGQLLTCAAGLQTVTVIWIASSFTPEHRAALDWLNQISQEQFHFFGLEIELWRIGKSALAPKFNVVSQPNGWTRTVAIASDEELTTTQRHNLEFWSGLCKQLDRRGSIVKPGDPSTKSYMGFAIGRAGFRLYARADSEDHCLTVELLLSGEDAKPHFHLLEEEREAIEAEMGIELEWDNQTDANDCSIYRVLPDVDPTDQERWTEYYPWLCSYLEQFHEVFAERIKHINANDYRPLPDYSFNPLKKSNILPNL